jgi:DnaJ like chaperone protein
MQRMQLDAIWRKHAIDAFDRGKQPGFQAASAIAELKAWTRGYRDLAYPIVDVVADTVLAEGAPTPAKLALLKQLAWSLRISELELMAMLAMKGTASQRPGGAWGGAPGGHGRAAPPPQRSAADPYAVLGLPRDADDAAIKRAYRKLISEHHPDRLGNLPEDLRRRAEQRASDINAAYDRIKEQRGFK